jgi:hypothetical protein
MRVKRGDIILLPIAFTLGGRRQGVAGSGGPIDVEQRPETAKAKSTDSREDSVGKTGSWKPRSDFKFFPPGLATASAEPDLRVFSK